ncbi:copper resistance CopC family protein [Nocardioides alkalitolerans]|uniref:copper resistance CopC family protein n=1 Tax=Nocardioides alkalitolerans TaxID=281714 RepID=UPI00040D8632|nr:copper resistance CopC family protein [Nocardioides alkalitolerans]
MNRRLLAVLLAAPLLALLGLGVVASPATAHASLVSSTPEADATLDALPGEVELVFSQDVRVPAYVVVTGPDGDVVEGDPVIDGETVSQAVSGSTEGGYTLAYRVISSDGHPITGQLAFSVGEGGPAAAEPEDAGAASGADERDGETLEATGDGAAAGTTADDRGWWSRHDDHVVMIGGFVLVAGAFLALALRRSRT